MSAGCTSGICCVTQLLLLLSSTCCLYLSPLSVSLSWHFQGKHSFSTFLPFLPSFYTKLKSFVTYAKDLITAYSHNKRLSPLYTKGTSRTQREDSKRNLAATWHHLLIWGKWSGFSQIMVFIFIVLDPLKIYTILLRFFEIIHLRNYIAGRPICSKILLCFSMWVARACLGSR